MIKIKNHKVINGKLLQTNKKWSHLKMKQKEMITDFIKIEHMSFITNELRSPRKKDKKEMLRKIYKKIEEREIWIPFREVELQFVKVTNKIESNLRETALEKSSINFNEKAIYNGLRKKT